MLSILTKVWKLLPGIIGLLQILLPLVKELVVIVIRIIDVFTWSDTVADSIIAKVNDVYNKVNNVVETLKNYLLGQ